MDLGHHIGGPAQDTGAAPQVEILTNQRADTVGTQLATGILEPALAVASHLIGQRLAALTPAGAQTGATRVLLANPVTVTTAQYRPLPANTALGLSAFYIAALTAVLTAVMLAVAWGLGMDAPYSVLLGLFAVAGSYGQLIGLLLFVYAGLTRGTLAAALGLLFWLVLGTAVVRWYDRKHLYRLHPDLLAHVSSSAQDYKTKQATPVPSPRTRSARCSPGRRAQSPTRWTSSSASGSRTHPYDAQSNDYLSFV